MINNICTFHFLRVKANVTRQYLGLAVLILLVFFTSCTVRKSVQTHLNIPVQKQLNVSKAVSTFLEVCENSTEDVHLQIDNSQKEIKSIFPKNFNSVSSKPAVERAKYAILKHYWLSHPDVPLYIRYSKMKILA
ncbi:hypothetical protein [Chondrinema litorale]|uniref:hypothetical protein n=1 Tax=Chondrinema litorale TaxID=2994555 RepID=UPI00254326F1|nr:hypothetical protein [Chondrinema litorale]UZR94201.1 hypothetical protein OQ292_20395 [Chondrinema litorale]